MAALTKLIQTRSVYQRFAGGSGLERGQVFAFTPGTTSGNHTYADLGSGSHFCWQSPGYGVAIIEVWGAGGSGGKMCCCSFGVPGNPGAYSKRTVLVQPNGWVCGQVGLSCGNDVLCFRGCSEPTRICWYSGKECCSGCICAMGGRGGWAFCVASNPGYCCFLACLFCASRPGWITGDGCGIVCNYSTCATAGQNCAAEGPTGEQWNVGRWMACAYGGDVNCIGGFSCAIFLDCNACCFCCVRNVLELPNGMFTEKRSEMQMSATQTESNLGAWYISPYFNTISGMTRSPSGGMPYTYCYATGGGANGSIACSCYEMWGTIPYVGVGVPGLSAMTCTNIRDHAMRGGHGGVRIQFIQNNSEFSTSGPSNRLDLDF